VAERKARAAASRLPGRAILAADTIVFLGEAILGKPRDAEDARRMLRLLSGRTHEVATGVALAHVGRIATRVERARVSFRALSEEEISTSVAGGEPMDKAGGYALQGAAAAWATLLEGSGDTVVGLPVEAVRALLREAGLSSGEPHGR
jgi:septum formation protein